MKTKKKEFSLEELKKHEMKQIYGGGGPKKVILVINGEIVIIWV